MTAEQDDGREAVEEAGTILEESRSVVVDIPLGTAYDVGSILVLEVVIKKTSEAEKAREASALLRRFEGVVPEELIQGGRDEYKGDLMAEVKVPLSFRDVNFIGRAATSTPSGRQMIDAFPIDPKDRAEIDGMRNQQFRSVLVLCDSFTQAGGKPTTAIRKTIEQQLS